MDIKKNIQNITQSLPSGCRLVAVSKTQPTGKILEAFEAGQMDFGENKVQELCQKFESLPKSIRWHLIGHLQSNKVKYVVPFVYLIHSVDSMKLLREIEKQASKVERIVDVLLQVHIAEEETKFGLDEKELFALLKQDDLALFSHVRILGLMGMATFTKDNTVIEAEFKKINMLFEKTKSMKLPQNVQFKELSIGMSSDYSIAINHGSTLVRVGSAIFGERN
jgi:pyridoxal phosphate enzyme (YggS family)